MSKKTEDTINTIQQLPDWFDVNNYLTPEMENKALEQFRYRFWLDNFTTFAGNQKVYERELLEARQSEVWKSICKKQPLVKSDAETLIEPTIYYKETISKRTIEGVHAIQGIDANWMVMLPDYLESRGTIKLKEIDDYVVKRQIDGDLGGDINYLCHLECDTQGSIMDGSVWLTVNLEQYTNKELVGIFEKLLPAWRRQLSIPEPKHSIGKDAPIKKITEYRVIPYLDLIVWAKLSKVKIPNRVMALALFPYGEKGEIEFVQTIIPFIKRITSINFRFQKEIEELRLDV